MKVLTNKERPGHQKSLSSRALVVKHPACPVVGESCVEQVMASFMKGNVCTCDL